MIREYKTGAFKMGNNKKERYNSRKQKMPLNVVTPTVCELLNLKIRR